MKEYSDELKEYISMAAFFLAQKNHPYNKLCWFLAERQLYIENNFVKPTNDQTRRRASEIYYSSPQYDVICWLISEIDMIIKGRK